MNFRDLAEKRYSVRKFSDKPVPPEVLRSILETARQAPTATNAQPQRILIIQSPEALPKLPDCTRSHFHAPLCLMICYDRETAWVRSFDGHHSGEVDASIITTYLMLAAEEQGLGTTWVMAFDPAKLRESYHIPEHLEPVALLPMGYPHDECQPAPRHFERKPVEEIIQYDNFA